MNILLHTVSLVYTMGRLARPRCCAPATFQGHKAYVFIALVMAWLGLAYTPRRRADLHAIPPPPRDFLICRRCYPDWVRSLLMSPLPLEVPLVSSYVPEVVQYGPRGAGVVQGANVAILQH